ncbi:MAG: RHS repeat-associated core domain-containing protein [Thermoleophilia bacterium]
MSLPIERHSQRSGFIKNVFLSALTTIFFLVFSSSFAQANTYISGNITQDTTWTAAGSVYVISGNVSIRPGVTLTVDPNVVVKFDGPYSSLSVAGPLDNLGPGTLIAKQAVFTSYTDDENGGDTNHDNGAAQPSAGGWGPISVSGAASFTQCSILWGKWQREKDNSTGTIRMGVREYDPELGRFASADPLQGTPTDPQQRNRYSYVGNDPLTRYDLSGYAWCGPGITDRIKGAGDWLGDAGGNWWEGVQVGYNNPDELWGATGQFADDLILNDVRTFFSADSSLNERAGAGAFLLLNLLPGGKAGNLGKVAKEAETAAKLGEDAKLLGSAAKRVKSYRHYGYAEDAADFAQGLRPGTYATHARGRPMSGTSAQQRLALPHETPPNAYYKVTVGPETPVYGPRRVPSSTLPPRSGGGFEYTFPEGTPPGSVTGPFPIPRS